jgi:hypothetical protein
MNRLTYSSVAEGVDFGHPAFFIHKNRRGQCLRLQPRVENPKQKDALASQLAMLDMSASILD